MVNRIYKIKILCCCTWIGLVALSCKEERLTQVEKNIQSETPSLSLEIGKDPTLDHWLRYYKKEAQDFSLAKFTFTRVDTLVFRQGNVLGSFDARFDKTYQAFLQWNANKTQYIDIDSYQWFLAEDGTASFMVDQEINWVNIPNGTVTRIKFNGANQWTEEAFWENDSVVVLLENNEKHQPMIIKVDLQKQTQTVFSYAGILKDQFKYTHQRLDEKGILIDHN